MEFVQIFTTYCLLGLIWVIQLIQYPAFLFVAEHRFESFHRFHSARIPVLVVPLMIGELVSTLWLTFKPGYNDPLQWTMSVLVIVVWISTFTLQVPIHNKLKHGKDEALIHRLVLTNWVRTAAWSFKAFLLTWIIA